MSQEYINEKGNDFSASFYQMGFSPILSQNIISSVLIKAFIVYISSMLYCYVSRRKRY